MRANAKKRIERDAERRGNTRDEQRESIIRQTRADARTHDR